MVWAFRRNLFSSTFTWHSLIFSISPNENINFQVTVTTAQGNTTSNPSLPYRTKPATPLAGPTVNGTALNHTTLLITWYPPEIKQLRGAVMTYVVDLSESSRPGAPISRVGQFPGNQTSVAVRNLKANTYYTFYVREIQVFFILLACGSRNHIARPLSSFRAHIVS